MPFVSAVTTANNNLGIEASTVAEMSTEVANVDELFSTKHVEVYSVDTTPESFAAVGITETQTVPTRYGRETSSALTSIEVFDTDMISRLNLSKVTPNESIAGFPTVTVTTDWVDAGSTDKLENSTKNISQKSSTEVVQADAIVSAPFSTIKEMPLSTAEDAVMHLRSHFYAENLQRSAEDLKEEKTIDTLELDNSNQFDDLGVRSAEEVDTSTEVTTKAHSVTVSPFAIADSVNQSFDFSLGQVPESSPSPDWLTAFITVMRTTTPATEASSLEQISYRTPTANKDLTQVMNDYDYEDQTVDNSSTMDFTTTDSSETEESLWHMESYEDYMQPIAMATLESSARDESSEVRVASTDKAYLTYEQNYPAKIEKNTSENSNTVTAKIVVTPEVKEIPEPAVPTDQRDSLAAYTMPTNTKLTPRGIPVDSKTETPIPTSNGMAIVDETEVISTSEDRPSSSTQFPIYLGAEYASTTMFPEKASDQGTIASIDMNYSGRDRTEAEYSGQTISSELHGSRDIRTESTMTEFGEVDYRGFTDKPDESFAFSSALQPTHKTQSDTTVKASSSSDVEFLLDGIGSPQPRSSIEETRPKEQESLPAKIDYSDEKEPLASNTVATEIVPKITDRVQSQPSYIEAENTLTLTDSSIHQEEWVKSHRITTRTWQESTSAKNIPSESFTSITESTALTDGVPTLDMFLPMSDHKIGVSSELQILRPKLIELKPTTGTINRSEWPLLGAVTAQSSVEVDNEFYQTSSESLYGLELRDRPSDVDRSALSTDSSAQSPLYDVITEVTQIYKNTSLRNTSTENEQQAIEERQAQLATSLNINQEMYEVTSNGIGIDGADSTVIGDSSTNPPHNRYMSSSSVQSYGSNDDMGLPERDGKLPIENADYAISMTGLPRLENAVLYRSTTGPVQRADRKLVISNIKPTTSLTLQRSVEENTPDAALQIAQVEPATVEPFGPDDDVTLPILSNEFYDAANYPLPRRENFYTTERLPLPKTDLATGAGLNNEAIVPDRRTITPFVSKSVEESNTLPPTEVAFDERIEEGKQWSRYQDRPIREPDEARLGLIESVVEASSQNKVLLRGAAPNSWPQAYSSTVAPDTDSRRESAEEFLEYDLDGEGKNSTPQNNDKAKIVIEQSVHLPAVKMFDVIIPPVQTVSSLRQSGVTVSSGKPVPRQHWQSAKNEILRHLSELDEHVRLGQANITGETSRLAAHMLRRHLANMSDTLQNSAIPPRLHTDNERQKQFDTIYSNLSLSIQGLNLTSNDAERAERLVASARASIQLARELILILADGSNDAESRIVIEQILSYARLMLLEVINSIRASSDKSALGLGHADLLSWEWLLGRTSRRQYVFSRVFSAKPHIFDAQIYRSANQ
ncbi:uncharacterized protein YMR317W-like [Varroa jacobsoni]|uniref:uncharacterized protein YMR317W-like n=1 Tax=Varroa jacobsoni TaxID=62625 RepID=UPI000BF8426A|nr:uncharacterized protein YMR317W-like [Varroa jacobsoni]